jgi:hypothetical protein
MRLSPRKTSDRNDGGCPRILKREPREEQETSKAEVWCAGINPPAEIDPIRPWTGLLDPHSIAGLREHNTSLPLIPVNCNYPMM